MEHTTPISGDEVRSPRPRAHRLPLLVGARAYRLLATVPGWVLFGAALSLTLCVVAPDMPFGSVAQAIGTVGAIFSLMLCVSPVALVVALTFVARRVKRAVAMRACDLVLTDQELLVAGGGAHGFRASLRDIATAGSVSDTPEAVSIRRGDGATLTIPKPLDPDERASLEALAAVLAATAAAAARGGAPPPSGRDAPSVLRCKGCGAPQVPDDAPAVRCPFCGVDNDVPLEVAAKIRAARMVDRQHRRDDALARALHRQPSARVANCVAFLGGGALLLGAAVASMMAGALLMVDGYEAGKPRLGALGLAEIGLALLLIAYVRRTLAGRRALRILTLGFSAVPPERPGAPSRCRTCGAPLSAPLPREMLVRCAYCHAENLRMADFAIQAEIVERFSAGAASPGSVLQGLQRRRRRAGQLGIAGILLVVSSIAWQMSQPSAPEGDGRAVVVPHEHRERSLREANAPVTSASGASELVEEAVLPARLRALVPAEGGHVAAVVEHGQQARIIEAPLGEVRAEALSSAPALPLARAIDRRSHAEPFVLVLGSEVRCLRGDGSGAVLYGTELLADPLITDLSAGPGCSALATTRASDEGHLHVRWLHASIARHIRADARHGVLAPDGRTVAATILRQEPERFHLAVLGQDGAEPRMLTAGAGQVALPAWSPDGQRIAFLSQPVRDLIQYAKRYGAVHLFVIDMGGNIQQLTAGGDLAFVRPVWTPRGIHVASTTRASSRIYRVVPR